MLTLLALDFLPKSRYSSESNGENVAARFHSIYFVSHELQRIQFSIKQSTENQIYLQPMIVIDVQPMRDLAVDHLLANVYKGDHMITVSSMNRGDCL